MFAQTPLPSTIPSGVLDMTADFAPLLWGMVIVLGLCVLGLAVATAVHDTWWEKRKEKKASDQPVPTPHFPKAA